MTEALLSGEPIVAAAAGRVNSGVFCGSCSAGAW